MLLIHDGRFRYFLDCYFNISFDFADLEKLAMDFKTTESQESVNRFLNELYIIRETGDWGTVQKFVRDHGMRNLSVERLGIMVDLLISVLSSYN
jgi:hypothetical protein